VALPGGFVAPRSQVEMVREELERVRGALADLAGGTLDDALLSAGIAAANRVRCLLAELRALAYTGRSMSAAGSGNAGGGDAGDPFLLGPRGND